MTLREKLFRFFLIFQFILFIPVIFLIGKSFFYGQDELQKSLLLIEADAFVKEYKSNKKIKSIETKTLSGYFGLRNVPEKYQSIFESLNNGMHELTAEDNIAGFEEGKEIRVVVQKVDKDKLYLMSVIPDKKGEKKLLKTLSLSITLYLIIYVITGFFVALIFAKKISNPLEAITHKIDFAKEDDLTTSLSDSSYGMEINKLAKVLENKNIRINSFIKREKEVMRNISHELRTPTTIIKSSLELASLNNNGDDSYVVDKRIINKITRASNNIESMIEAFLWLGREEKSKSTDKVNCLKCIEKAVEDHHYLIEKKSIDLIFNVENNVYFSCKEPIFYIVIANLIRNAFVYTEEGEITITLMSNIFSVGDSGVGMSESINAKLDCKYQKESNDKGFGFGLDIVDRICEQMGWCLTVGKKDNEKGTLALLSFS